MAHGDDPASATTSFFIVTGDASSLDGKYTAFGRVVDGMAVVDAIEQAPVQGEAPVSRIELKQVRIVKKPSPAGGQFAVRERSRIRRPRALTIRCGATWHTRIRNPSDAAVTLLLSRRLRRPRASLRSWVVSSRVERRLAAVARCRGATGVSTETGLLKEWPAGGPRLAWRVAGAGDGYSSFSVAGGRLFTLGGTGRHRVRPRVRCGVRQEAVGGRQRPPLQQRPRRRAAQHPDGRRRSRLRVRVERRHDRARRGERQGVLDPEPPPEVRRLATSTGD